MLASDIDDVSLLKFPVLCTPKYDGIRCIKHDNTCVSRSMKSIRNEYIRSKLLSIPYSAYTFDGELVSGNFQSTTSAVMSKDGEPDFQYYVFDLLVGDPKIPYISRIARLSEISERLPDYVTVLIPTVVNSQEELNAYEEEQILKGFEGVIVRSFDGPYKEGRSTFKEGYLLRLKRFKDSEARIIGFEELTTNQNKPITNALGYTERSTTKTNLIPANTLGNLLVEDIYSGAKFGVGSGFSKKQRRDIWENMDSHIGLMIKYKFQKHGSKEVDGVLTPRIPIFKGIRDEEDL